MYSPHSRQHSVNSQGSLPRPGQLTRQDSRWTTITESGKSAKIVSYIMNHLTKHSYQIGKIFADPLTLSKMKALKICAEMLHQYHLYLQNASIIPKLIPRVQTLLWNNREHRLIHFIVT